MSEENQIKYLKEIIDKLEKQLKESQEEVEELRSIIENIGTGKEVYW
jgi:prefoldin subunit 5